MAQKVDSVWQRTRQAGSLRVSSRIARQVVENDEHSDTVDGIDEIQGRPHKRARTHGAIQELSDQDPSLGDETSGGSRKLRTRKYDLTGNALDDSGNSQTPARTHSCHAINSDGVLVASEPRHPTAPATKPPRTLSAKGASVEALDHETPAQRASRRKAGLEENLASLRPNTPRRQTKDPHSLSTPDRCTGKSNKQAITTPTYGLAEDTDVQITHAKTLTSSARSRRSPSLSIIRTSASKRANHADILGSLQLQTIQNVLTGRFSGQRAQSNSGLQEEFSKVSAVVTQTVVAGESNSMLIIGARGSGKTTLVNQLIRELRTQHGDDFFLVRLNGFTHTDDKIALREIWRQLGRDTEVNEAEATSKNNADTLTTLLALLSHSTDGERPTNLISKSVIFVLDEFHLFTHHARQTLLYNLFDIAQSRKAPIAVLGLTTRVDVVDSLEKRVKSRFSHRYIHLSQASSFEVFKRICKTSLCIYVDELSNEEFQSLTLTARANGFDGEGDSDAEALVCWNSFVDRLCETEAFSLHLKQIYYTTKSVPKFTCSQWFAVQTLPLDDATTTTDLIEHFVQALSQWHKDLNDSKLHLLPTLSTLQLGLLVCAARLNAIYDEETVTFLLAYEEYKGLGSKARLQASASGALSSGGHVSSKAVAKLAWEDLMACGLIMDIGKGSGRVDIGLEEIRDSGVDLGHWARWCKEI